MVMVLFQYCSPHAAFSGRNFFGIGIGIDLVRWFMMWRYDITDNLDLSRWNHLVSKL